MPCQIVFLESLKCNYGRAFESFRMDFDVQILLKFGGLIWKYLFALELERVAKKASTSVCANMSLKQDNKYVLCCGMTSSQSIKINKNVFG